MSVLAKKIKFINNINFDLLLNDFLEQVKKSQQQIGVFDTLQVVVNNSAMQDYLRAKVAEKLGICANIEFIPSISILLNNIYTEATGQELFSSEDLRYAIYEYLITQELGEEFAEIKRFLGSPIDYGKVFDLSSQLQIIFREYFYLRSDLLLDLNSNSSISKIKPWQKTLLKHILKSTQGKATYLDVIQYFQSNSELHFSQLLIFGLHSVDDTQLKIIKKIAQRSDVYWFYKATSDKYYGDIRKKRNLNVSSLNDLYLTQANPLLSNLGQQSREFIEVLYTNDVYEEANTTQIKESQASYLDVLQDDICNLNWRINKNKQWGQEGIYAEPVISLADRERQAPSININSCYNKAREVQVMFNEITDYLNTNSQTKLDEILVIAPQIDDYANYIEAVFSNETIYTQNNQEVLLYLNQDNRKLFNITGQSRAKDYKVLELLQLLLKISTHLPVSELLTILQHATIKNNLRLENAEVEKIKYWLEQNNVHFAYDDVVYNQSYCIHGLKHFVQNLIYGACLPQAVFEQNNQEALLDDVYAYDNLEFAQILVADKLVVVLDCIIALQQVFYDDKIQKECSLNDFIQAIEQLRDKLLTITDDRDILNKFIASLRTIPNDLKMNLNVCSAILDDYLKDSVYAVRFNGGITCTSMSYVRNIPFKYIYVLGLNFGEFPHQHIQNKLSVLAEEWRLADKNYNADDKQSFLDTLLAAKDKITLSYIGCDEKNNAELSPSPILQLVMDSIKDSFELSNYQSVLTKHSLHSFYNNQAVNYSIFWDKLNGNTLDTWVNKHWDFKAISPVILSAEQKEKFYSPRIDDVCRTFLYNNSNLYRVLGVSTFDNSIKLQDEELFVVQDGGLAKAIFKEFEKDPNTSLDYLVAKNLLPSGNVGVFQFEDYLKKYQIYVQMRGHIENFTSEINFNQDICLKISGEIYVEDNKVIIMPDYHKVKEVVKTDTVKLYELKIKAIIIYLLLRANQDNRDVVIRQIDFNQETKAHDLTLTGASDTSKALHCVLNYYLRSLANPVMIHKNAAYTYSNGYRDACVNFKDIQQNDTKYNEAISKAKISAKSELDAGFNNFARNNLEEDYIFATQVESCFEYSQLKNNKEYIINDIARIGELLGTFKFKEIKEKEVKAKKK